MPLINRARTVAGLALAAAASLAPAQSTLRSSTPELSAASVRWLCRDAACLAYPDGIVADPTSYDCDNCDLWDLLLPAFGVNIYRQFHGAPRWFADDYYQVRIKAVAPVASKAQLEQSLLKLVLEKCFALEVRRRDAAIRGYALTVAASGIKFSRTRKPATSPDRDGVQHFTDTASLVRWLNFWFYANRMYGVTRPVRDATGLTGTFDIPLPSPKPGSGINLLAAIGRLGLEVKSVPSTETTYEILHVERLAKSCVLP